MSEKAKSCPFCGAGASARSWNEDGMVHPGCPVGCLMFGRLYPLETWNRRAPRFTPEERESLEAAITLLENHGCTPHPAEELRKILQMNAVEEKR